MKGKLLFVALIFFFCIFLLFAPPLLSQHSHGPSAKEAAQINNAIRAFAVIFLICLAGIVFLNIRRKK